METKSLTLLFLILFISCTFQQDYYDENGQLVDSSQYNNNNDYQYYNQDQYNNNQDSQNNYEYYNQDQQNNQNNYEYYNQDQQNNGYEYYNQDQQNNGFQFNNNGQEQFNNFQQCSQNSSGCNLRYDWACGRLQDSQCLNPPCYITYRNQCIACSDSRVIEFRQGRCVRDSELKLFCTNNRPNSCNNANFPVCGFSDFGGRQSYRNQCWACRDRSVSYYTKGNC